MRGFMVILGLLAFGAFVSGVSTPSARAKTSGGGSNIASAPTVTSGQQTFGNTTDGCLGNCSPADYWKLALIAGDRVTVDWEAQGGNPGSPYAEYFNVYE